jgi:hypothetical protein
MNAAKDASPPRAHWPALFPCVWRRESGKMIPVLAGHDPGRQSGIPPKGAPMKSCNLPQSTRATGSRAERAV